MKNVSLEDVNEREKKIKDQSKNVEWKRQRLLRITSTNFHKICTMTTKTDVDSFVRKLMCHTEINTLPIQHGRRCEMKAIKLLEDKLNIKTKAVGLIISQSHPYLAASPDRMGVSFVVEVKCPYSARFKLISPETVPYIYLDDQTGLYALSETHQYYYQVQGQMFCSGKNLCLFSIFTFKHFLIIKVPRNEDFIKAMVEKLKQFFEARFKKAVLEKFLYKNYSKYFWKKYGKEK